MKSLNTKFCIIFMTILSGISQTSYTFFTSTVTAVKSEITDLTQQQFNSQLAILKTLQKTPMFRALAEQGIQELTQRWNEQHQAIPVVATIQKPVPATHKQTATPAQASSEMPDQSWQNGYGL